MNSITQVTRAVEARGSRSEQRVRQFLDDPAFPCVGAKSALSRNRITFAEFDGLTSRATAARLCDRLAAFSDANPDPGTAATSFVAMFARRIADELVFEADLWALLQAMHEHDRARFAWDSTVGSDPSKTDFSYSIAGRAYFVVGLHPQASRWSRRAPVPCVVFNFHNQFEALQASGMYRRMQAMVRARDMALQGSINPMLARFGEASEARQYAGRAVEDSWRCPWQNKADGHA